MIEGVLRENGGTQPRSSRGPQLSSNLFDEKNIASKIIKEKIVRPPKIKPIGSEKTTPVSLSKQRPLSLKQSRHFQYNSKNNNKEISPINKKMEATNIAIILLLNIINYNEG
jgi:hypothetical protein